MKNPTIKQVLAAERKATEARKRAEHLRKLLQFRCKHARVIETRYEEESYVSYAKPEFRVCLACGFAEEGWRCGFQILTAKPERTRVDREEAYKLRSGKIHGNTQFYCRGQASYRRAALLAALELPDPDAEPEE